MKDLSLYKKHFKIKNLDDLIKKFLDSCLESNMTFSYFCDWRKIRENVEKHTYEINILNYLIGVSDVKSKLREILKRNPETLKILPLIIAFRDLDITVIRDPENPAETLSRYDFNRRELSAEDIDNIISFCEKSGILSLFTEFKIKNLRDYLLGVETGLDTNARKNRSGIAMEILTAPIFNRIKGIEIYSQKTFKSITNTKKIPKCIGMEERKFDYIIKTKTMCYNVEVNYYSGPGSKPQEIVDSYINRNNELRQSGWGFIWITDGAGCWRNQTNQLTKAFKDIDYVLNLSFAKSDILQDILE